jgi:glycosyltransferase involved in cell wall biosynthesis
LNPDYLQVNSGRQAVSLRKGGFVALENPETILKKHCSSITVVVPVLNEEDVIEETVTRSMKTLDGMVESGHIEWGELVIVDDGSTDSTKQILDRLLHIHGHCRDHENSQQSDHQKRSELNQCVMMRVIAHPENMGYGAALKTGFSSSQATHLSFYDADGTYPIENLPQLMAECTAEVDLVVGSRMVSGTTGMPLTRRIGNRFFAWLLSMVGGTPVSDSASGMRVMSRDSYQSLPTLPDGLNFTPAMSARMICSGMRVVETPIPYHERVGDSKLSVIVDGLRFLTSILGIALMYDPMKLFGPAGLLLLAGAFGLGIEPVRVYLATGAVADRFVPALIGVLALASGGINIAAFGVMASFIIERTAGVRARRGILGRAMCRHTVKRLGWASAIVMTAGIAALYRPIHLAATGAPVHWSFWLAGAFLALLGTQLGAFTVLASMLTSVSSDAPVEGSAQETAK